ncbi:DUF1906 domain-containing protein [Brevibacillus nitrificans]|uniref:DUF1906 domain-containing protein n=1 Tax=Brevibacillus nitrificans TaxID=651560 RepID=UPI001FEC392F|nr:DUF1906 domain-containing protein [Brevibacillus nitrificans]
MENCKGIDCAIPLTVVKAKAIAEAGMKFVCRYLVPAQYAWKRLTRAEAELISAAGMKVVSVFQRGNNDAAGGATNGTRDGIAALQEAKSIGQPEGTAIYFAVDYDAQPADYNAIEAYLRAAAKELPGYLIGVYGSYAVVDEMAKRGACSNFWQTYAWSKGRLSLAANLHQYKNGQTLAGHTVDLNDGLGDEGWWDTHQQKGDNPVNNSQATPLTLEDWEREAGLKAIDSLACKGLLNEPDKWKLILKEDPAGVLSELPWLMFTMLDRVTEKIK